MSSGNPNSHSHVCPISTLFTELSPHLSDAAFSRLAFHIPTHVAHLSVFPYARIHTHSHLYPLATAILFLPQTTDSACSALPGRLWVASVELWKHEAYDVSMKLKLL